MRTLDPEEVPRQEPRKDDDEENRPSPLGPLNVFGIVLLCLGGTAVLAGFSLNTSSGGFHTLDKLANAIQITIAGVGLFIAGAIFLVSPSGREE